MKYFKAMDCIKAYGERENGEKRSFDTPGFGAGIYGKLPGMLRESAELFEEGPGRDVFLTGSLAVLSGCLPNIRGIYFDEPCSPHLYAFITAPAGSGKGKMKWARYFGQTIHEHLTEASKSAREEYRQEMERYNNLAPRDRLNENKPCEPLQKMFFIPANSSSAAFIQALADNDFTGVIFETEADTLANTFKQEWGNFSDVLRKAFHHESTSLFRRKDQEFIDIKEPHLAIALSGTPRQVQNMMPDTENGLFSRFLFYAFEDESDFKNPFVSHRRVDYVNFFGRQGERVYKLYQQLNRRRRPVNFRLTPEQAGTLTERFNVMLRRSKLLLGSDLTANIKRLGLIAFRIAMTLSALRIPDEKEILSTRVCSEVDFTTALDITAILEKHAAAVYQTLSNKSMKGMRQKFFEALPEEFDRKTFLKIAGELGIGDKNAEKYIGSFRDGLVRREGHKYFKLMSEL